MPYVLDGGTPHTAQISVGTTPTLLFPDRSPNTGLPPRSSAIAQQAGSADVTIGGPDVVAGHGPVLRGNPDSTTQPAAFHSLSSDRAIYGVVASGTGTVNTYEEY